MINSVQLLRFNTKGKSPIDVCSTNYMSCPPRKKPALHFIVPSACGGLICKTTSLLWKGGCSIVAGLSPGPVFDRIIILDQKLDCVGGPGTRINLLPGFPFRILSCSFAFAVFVVVVVVVVVC